MVQYKLDTGAEGNVIHKEALDTMQQHSIHVQLSPPKYAIVGVGNGKVKNYGTCNLMVTNPLTKKRHNVEFQVIDRHAGVRGRAS